MRFYGAVGYADSSETVPGVWKDTITELLYFGDVVRNSRRLDPPPSVPPELNSNLTLDNQFSIVGDAEAYENFLKMRYVIWEGVYWRITNVLVQRPRLILTVGGIWDGVKA